MDTKELLEKYETGERDFSGANLEGANLEGANLRGATIPSSSHDAISEILRQQAETIPQYMLAGFVLMRRDWCWRKFISNLKDTYPDQLRWALRILAEQKGTDEKAQSFLEFVSPQKEESEEEEQKTVSD